MVIRKIVSGCLMAFFVASVLLFFERGTSAAKPVPPPPVTYTAPVTLYWLSKAKVPEAIEYVQYIDAEAVVRPDNIKQYERVEKVNKIYQEIRYASLNDYFVSNHYANVIDLGCGVSPRCLYTSKRGINYVGTDLDEVVKVLDYYAPNFLSEDGKNYVRFVVADAADRKAMLNAAKGLDGKICIVEEGLLIYLSRDQQRATLKSIRDILKENGGCFLTSNFVAGEIFMSIGRTLYGNDDAIAIGLETKKLYEDLSEILFNDTMFKSTEEAIQFIEDAGLKVEAVPLFQNAVDIRSIRDLNNADLAKMNELMQQKLLWVITVDDAK